MMVDAPPGKLIALSEAAVDSWRNVTIHREMFMDYRLRVAKVLRDYGKFDRKQAPDDSQVEVPAKP
jgi:hypothetical protein